MTIDWTQIITAGMAFLASLVSVLIVNSRNQTLAEANQKHMKELFEQRFDQIEKKLDKHNHLVERMTAAEVSLQDVCDRVEKLESGKK